MGFLDFFKKDTSKLEEQTFTSCFNIDVSFNFSEKVDYVSFMKRSFVLKEIANDTFEIAVLDSETVMLSEKYIINPRKYKVASKSERQLIFRALPQPNDFFALTEIKVNYSEDKIIRDVVTISEENNKHRLYIKEAKPKSISEVELLVDLVAKVLTKEKNKDVFYQNYLMMKASSNKQKQILNILNQGISKYDRRNYKDAYNIFSRAINFEADTDAYHNRGVCCMDLGDLFNAISDFSSAIMFTPTYSPPRHNRALCILEILNRNSELYSQEDLVTIARNDLRIAVRLGHSNSQQYLNQIEGI